MQKHREPRTRKDRKGLKAMIAFCCRVRDCLGLVLSLFRQSFEWGNLFTCLTIGSSSLTSGTRDDDTDFSSTGTTAVRHASAPRDEATLYLQSTIGSWCITIIMVFHLILLLYSCLVVSCVTETPEERLQWVTAVQQFHHLSHPHIHPVIEILHNVSFESSIPISSACRSDLIDFASGLKAGNTTQMLMFDSFSQPLGILSNQGHNFGAYRQCLKTGSRYTLLTISFPIPGDDYVEQKEEEDDWRISWSKNIQNLHAFPYFASLCLPDQCTEADIQSLINSPVVKEASDPLILKLVSTESYSDDWGRVTGGQLVMCLILGLLGQAGIWSTLISWLAPESPIGMTVAPFDAVSNIKKLFSSSNDASKFASKFHLFRTILLLFGIWCNCLFSLSPVLLFRSPVTSSFLSPWLESTMRSIPLIVAAGFVASSAFSTVSTLTAVSLNGSMSFTDFAVARVVRPMSVTLVSLSVFLAFPMMHFSGPLGKVYQSQTKDICLKFGWRDLIFVSNFFPMSESCNVFQWFLAVDLQLCFLSVPLILLIAARPRLGMKFLIAVIVAGIIASGLYSSAHDLKPLLDLRPEHMADTMDRLHETAYHTIHYLPVYGIGIFLGYFLFSHKEENSVTHGFGLATCAASAVAMMMLIAFAGRTYDGQTNFLFGSWTEQVFTYSGRVVAGILAAMTCYAFLKSDHWFILSLHSNPIIRLISRLSYCILVTHALMLNLIIASLEDHKAGMTFIVVVYLAVLILSVATAIPLYLVVEAPVQRFLTPVRSKSKQT